MNKLLIVLAFSTTLAYSVCGQIYDTNNDVAQIFAGSGTPGFLNAQGTLAIFNGPNGIASDSSGNLYVSDANNNRIRMITTNGTVSSFIGGGSAPLPGYGTSVSLSFYSLGVMVADKANTLWIVAQSGGFGLLHIGSDGYVEYLTFTGVYGGTGLCVDSANNLFYSTQTQIYRLGADGTLVAYAGSGNNGFGNPKKSNPH